MAKEEANFKVCGLCSQLVDESVQIDESLRGFLRQFLGVFDYDFPVKICTECYQGTLDAKRFQDRCLRAIKKIKKTHLSATMILGKSSRDSLSSYISPSSEFRHENPSELEESKTLDYEQSHSYSSRHSSSSSNKRQFLTSTLNKWSNTVEQPVIVIKKGERELAEFVKNQGGLFDESFSLAPPLKKSRKTLAPPPLFETEEVDDVEIFPSIGPYQCEICQKITETKLEFVTHIKRFHRSVVDEEVLNSLEHDLKKVQKKLAAQTVIKSYPSSFLSSSSRGKLKKESSRLKGKRVKKKSSGIKSTKSTSLSETAEQLASRTCSYCTAILKYSRDLKKHQNTKSCKLRRQILAESQSKLDNEEEEQEQENSNRIVERTCQYCSKVLDKVKDLETHYTTKACQAKKYELEKQPITSHNCSTSTNSTHFDSKTTTTTICRYSSTTSTPSSPETSLPNKFTTNGTLQYSTSAQRSSTTTTTTNNDLTTGESRELSVNNIHSPSRGNTSVLPHSNNNNNNSSSTPSQVKSSIVVNNGHFHENQLSGENETNTLTSEKNENYNVLNSSFSSSSIPHSQASSKRKENEDEEREKDNSSSSSSPHPSSSSSRALSELRKFEEKASSQCSNGWISHDSEYLNRLSSSIDENNSEEDPQSMTTTPSHHNSNIHDIIVAGHETPEVIH